MHGLASSQLYTLLDKVKAMPSQRTVCCLSYELAYPLRASSSFAESAWRVSLFNFRFVDLADFRFAGRGGCEQNPEESPRIRFEELPK